MLIWGGLNFNKKLYVVNVNLIKFIRLNLQHIYHLLHLFLRNVVRQHIYIGDHKIKFKKHWPQANELISYFRYNHKYYLNIIKLGACSWILCREVLRQLEHTFFNFVYLLLNMIIFLYMDCHLLGTNKRHQTNNS